MKCSFAQRSVVIIWFVATTSATSARADSIKFCFTGPMVYSDNGTAAELPDGTQEDYWAGDGTSRFLRGARIVVKIGSTTYFDDVVGDGEGAGDPGNGCTSTLTVPNANSTYFFYHHSLGTKIDNDFGDKHTVNVRHIDDPLVVSSLTTIIAYTHYSGSGTFSMELSGDSLFEQMLRLQTTAAFVLWRAARVAEANTFDVYLEDRNNAGSEFEDGDVFIKSGDSSKKFVIAHEMGHALAACYAGAAFGADCDFNDSACSASSHSMTSKEYQPCAFSEGLAHAFSAFTWNLTTESDCAFGYWGGGGYPVDCEGSQTHVNRYMEINCSTPFSDKGVELDWLKAFWDVHTNGGVDLGEFADWLWDASWFWVWQQTWTDPYLQLEDAADDCGSACDDLDTNWDVAKTSNGVDW